MKKILAILFFFAIPTISNAAPTPKLTCEYKDQVLVDLAHKRAFGKAVGFEYDCMQISRKDDVTLLTLWNKGLENQAVTVEHLDLDWEVIPRDKFFIWE